MTLTDNRIASLNALGFDWNPDTKKKLFEQRIEELQSYKKKHGQSDIKVFMNFVRRWDTHANIQRNLGRLPQDLRGQLQEAKATQGGGVSSYE